MQSETTTAQAKKEGEMLGHYKLEGKVAIPCEDIKEWGYSFEHSNRRVAAEDIGDVRVSTVFLGLDHSWGEGPPLLFETMVFGGLLDQEMDRCSTWEEAEKMHKRMVEKVKLSLTT